jgi:hypothetical protein
VLKDQRGLRGFRVILVKLELQVRLAQPVKTVKALIGEAPGVGQSPNHTWKMMQFTTKAVLT